MNTRSLLAMAVISLPILSQCVAAMELGERGRLAFPFKNSRSDNQPISASIEILSKPSWMLLLPRSNYGPVSIPANETSPLLIEFKAGAGYSTNQTDEMVVALNFQPSDMFAQSLICRISSKDGFVSHIQDCSDQAGLRIAETLYADHSPPQTKILTSAPAFIDMGGMVYYSTQTRITLAYSDVEISSYATSGIDAFTYSIDGTSATVPPGLGEIDLIFPEGAHVFAFSATDSANNVEPIFSTAAFFDGTPPISHLLINNSSVSPDSLGRLAVPEGGQASFLAKDLASGVYAIDYSTGSELAQFAGSINLPNGVHELFYRARDNVGSIEDAHSVLLFVGVDIDSAPPIISLSLDGLGLIQGDLATIAPNTNIVLSGADPSGPSSSGLAEIRYLVDADPASCGGALADIGADPYAPPGSCANSIYTSTFTLSIGSHSLVFSGTDRARNMDSLHYYTISVSSTSDFLMDTTPPRTLLLGGIPSVPLTTTTYVSSSSLLGFSVFDDKRELNDGLGVGATQTFYALNDAVFARFSNSFSLVSEGTHTISYFSIDRVGNPETPKIQSVGADFTPPSATLELNGNAATIDAVDPVVSGAASGVARIRYLVDYGNPDVCSNVAEDTSAARGTCENPWYAGPFTLSNGPHTLHFQAYDAVGNAEVLRTTYPFVEAPGSGPSAGGMGIGKDALDAFWTVVSQNNALAFAHSNSSGVLISSSTLQDAVEGFPWSVLFGPDGRAYAVGGAAGPATQALDLAVYKGTLFDSGYANNDIAFDAKAPGWIVGAAQTSGPTDLAAPGPAEFSMALWRFDPALGTVQLKTTYARAGFDLGAGLAVDADGSLWITGYSLSPAAPAVGGFDLALWHYAADGQTLLGGPFLRPGYLDNIDGGLTARVFVSSQAVYVAAPRANNSGGTDMAFLRYDKASGLPTSEIAWRSALGAPSYPIAVLPEASGILVAGGIGGNLTEAGLWRFGFDGALQGVTTTDAGGATGAVFRGSELWLSVDGSTVPYRVQAEVAVAGSLVDLVPPRTSLSAGAPSFTEAQTVYVTSATPLGFAVADDYAAFGDGLGVGSTQTFYADGGGAYSRFTSSFTLVAEGTHTVSFYSIDLEGRAEAVKTQSVGVDLTAPVVTLVSSGSIFSIVAVDPVVGGAASGVGQIQYLVDHDPECNVAQSTAAPPGTCENLTYAGPFELAVGTHTV
ncbi:MAG: hypothetical protein HYX59_05855, partial [Elusimicrobia bacterium]|nr:hypothetical protein [Elusimicrobiota bacterium]